MKPTIDIIAKHAGVSRGTVDRVLHGRPNVKEEKRQRVLDSLRELDYSPNPAARVLALKDRKIKVAILLPCWTGFFETEVKRGIKAAISELADYGLEIIVKSCKTDAPDECVELIDDMIAQGVKGIAVCAKNSVSVQEKLSSLSKENIPVVTFNSDIPGSGRMYFAGQNVVKGGRIAAEIMTKLVQEDGKILVVCGNMEFDAHKNRVEGFVTRFKELGREEGLFTVVQTFNDYDLTYQRISGSLAAIPDIAGIYMANESVPACVEVINRAKKKGKIHVICHDLSEYTTKYLQDGSVDFVIEQNLFQQGFMPVSILANYLIAGKKPTQDIEYTRINIVNAENID